MNVSVILGHPDPASFNHAVAETVVAALTAEGHTVRFHDLYAESFNPVLPSFEIPKHADLDPLVRRHCDELSAADGIVIIHPNWWGQPPAIMKGWIDRVIRPGVAYEFKQGDSGEGVPCGVTDVRRRTFGVVVTSTEEQRREWLREAAEAVNGIFG